MQKGTVRNDGVNALAAVLSLCKNILKEEREYEKEQKEG